MSNYEPETNRYNDTGEADEPLRTVINCKIEKNEDLSNRQPVLRRSDWRGMCFNIYRAEERANAAHSEINIFDVVAVIYR